MNNLRKSNFTFKNLIHQAPIALLLGSLLSTSVFAGQVSATVDLSDVKAVDSKFTQQQCEAIYKSHTLTVNKEIDNVSISDSFKIAHSKEIQSTDLHNGRVLRLIQGVGTLLVDGKSESFPVYMVVAGKKILSKNKNDLKGLSETGFMMGNHCSAKVHVVYK